MLSFSSPPIVTETDTDPDGFNDDLKGNDGNDILYGNIPGVLNTGGLNLFTDGYINVETVLASQTMSAMIDGGGNLVSLAAPGEGIITTYPRGAYAAVWGTSFSTPLVSGTAALFVGIKSTLSPGEAAWALAQAKPKVVVVGGGPGGATVAKYVAKDGGIDVTLVEPAKRFTTCFHSNLYLGGFKKWDDITHSYEKLKRKIGDYATAAAAVILTLAGGKVASCAIGLTNVGETALFAEEAGRIVTGSSLDAASVKKAVAAAEAITSPASDARGPAHYRTKMAGVMLTRALARAKERARG